jgi:hypothetical protein
MHCCCNYREKKVPLLADNKDTEGTDADQEVGE